MKQKRFTIRMVVTVSEFDTRQTSTKVAASVMNAIADRGLNAKITSAREWRVKGKADKA